MKPSNKEEFILYCLARGITDLEGGEYVYSYDDPKTPIVKEGTAIDIEVFSAYYLQLVGLILDKDSGPIIVLSTIFQSMV